MAGKFVLKKSGKENFVFNLRASNGLVILTSEVYKNKASALKGIESVRKNVEKDANFERRVAKNGQPFFVLRAANKEILGQSERYARAANVTKGIEAVKANARSAKLEDLTEKK